MANIETLNLTDKGIMAFQDIDPFSKENGELVQKKCLDKKAIAKIKRINIALGNGILS